MKAQLGMVKGAPALAVPVVAPIMPTLAKVESALKETRTVKARATYGHASTAPQPPTLETLELVGEPTQEAVEELAERIEATTKDRAEGVGVNITKNKGGTFLMVTAPRVTLIAAEFARLAGAAPPPPGKLTREEVLDRILVRAIDISEASPKRRRKPSPDAPAGRDKRPRKGAKR